jgi:prepilin-type N-terminal cleavage/methylation domain-containing protein
MLVRMEVKKMKNQKGFTLVELLVVIAIIAVLSAVAVVNLNSARNKGVDASRQANMSALPAAAEIWYDDNNLGHDGFCGADSIVPVATSITNGGETLVCNDASVVGADGWRAYVPLTGTNEWFCVDWEGAAAVVTTIPTATFCNCGGTGITTCT